MSRTGSDNRHTPHKKKTKEQEEQQGLNARATAENNNTTTMTMMMMIGTKTNQSLTLLSLLALSVLSLCGRPTTAFVPQQAITTKTAVSCPNGVSVTETKRRSMLLWGTTTVNGDVAAHIKDVEKDGTSSRTDGTLSPAPPLTYDKYVTMQVRTRMMRLQFHTQRCILVDTHTDAYSKGGGTRRNR